jgi:hypothetical protein
MFSMERRRLPIREASRACAGQTRFYQSKMTSTCVERCQTSTR